LSLSCVPYVCWAIRATQKKTVSEPLYFGISLTITTFVLNGISLHKIYRLFVPIVFIILVSVLYGGLFVLPHDFLSYFFIFLFLYAFYLRPMSFVSSHWRVLKNDDPHYWVLHAVIKNVSENVLFSFVIKDLLVYSLVLFVTKDVFVYILVLFVIKGQKQNIGICLKCNRKSRLK
jgi:hypothetical protein